MSDDAELTVRDVRQAVPAGAGVEAGMVVLQEKVAPGRVVRIVIGQAEAHAIHAAWALDVPLRPGTWDLFTTVIQALGGRLERAVITAVHERRHYYALIELRLGDDLIRLDCRASDAIALALRARHGVIAAAPDVLDNAGVVDGLYPLPDPIPDPEPPSDSAPEPTADPKPEGPSQLETETSDPEAKVEGPSERETETVGSPDAEAGGPSGLDAKAEPPSERETETVGSPAPHAKPEGPSAPDPKAQGQTEGPPETAPAPKWEAGRPPPEPQP